MTEYYRDPVHLMRPLEEREMVGQPMTHYIYATGCTCYDRTGVTFPTPHIPKDFDAILRKHGVTKSIWKNQYGWSNQPEVLCFQATEEQAKAIDDEIGHHDGLMVKTCGWA